MRLSLVAAALGLNVSLIASSSSLAQQAAPSVSPATQPGAIGQQPQPQAQQQPTIGGAAAPVEPHLIVQGIPGVAQCPAPDWIKPGMRLTFLQASASIQSNPNDPSLVEDPNGDIVDDRGRRWRETLYHAGGAGGAGYSIVNIVAVEPGVIVMQADSYLLVNGNAGPASLTTTIGCWCHSSGCDYFLHPRMLAQLPQVERPGFSIMRHTYDVNNQHFNAVRITNISNGRMTYVYDLSSGVLLSQNGSSVAPGGQVYRDGYIVTTTGNTLAITRYINSRDLNLPWQTSPMPDWVRTAKRMRYTGARVTKGPPNIGVQDFSIGLDVTVETSYVGNTFAVYKVSTQPRSPSDIPGANDPSTAVAVCGPGSLGGLWMSPAALRQLRTGQAIDTDATTGTQTVVEFAGAGGQGQNGKAIAVITSNSRAQKIQCVYDATDGKLLRVTGS